MGEKTTREEYERAMKRFEDEMTAETQGVCGDCESDDCGNCRSISAWLEKRMRESAVAGTFPMWPEEMESTAPSHWPCGNCGDMSEECASISFPDNRMELYRKFALMATDIPGASMWYCKKCLISCFSRESLYEVTKYREGGRAKETRRVLLVERVKCFSCGREYRRVERTREEQLVRRATKIMDAIVRYLATRETEKRLIGTCACASDEETDREPAIVIPISSKEVLPQKITIKK